MVGFFWGACVCVVDYSGLGFYSHLEMEVMDEGVYGRWICWRG